jgi:hypothetical protein
MARSHPYPFAFTDIQLCATGVHKVELPEWVLLMQMTVSLQGSTTVRTRVNYGEAVKVSPLVRCGVGFQGFDDEPLVGVGLAYLSSEHVVSFASASSRLWEHSRCVGISVYLSYASHLYQRCLCLGKPEGHLHGTVERDGGG